MGERRAVSSGCEGGGCIVLRATYCFTSCVRIANTGLAAEEGWYCQRPDRSIIVRSEKDDIRKLIELFLGSFGVRDRVLKGADGSNAE